jgi:uncharacterized membrane protein
VRPSGTANASQALYLMAIPDRGPIVRALQAHAPAYAESSVQDCADFRAIITPNKSLDATSYRFLLTFIVALSAAFHVVYIALGLYVVAGMLFCVTAALVAMLMLFRSSQRREEIVTVADGQIDVMRFRKGMPVAQTRFSQIAVRIECERDPDYGLRHVRLRQRDVVLEIARDLSPGERVEFLEAFRRALAGQGARVRIETVLAASAA